MHDRFANTNKSLEHALVNELESIRAFALDMIAEGYLARPNDGQTGKFTIYDSLPEEAEISPYAGTTERFYSVISKESEETSSLGVYYREYEYAMPMVRPARLEAFQFKWSNSQILKADLVVVQTTSPEYAQIPNDDQLILVQPSKQNIHSMPVGGKEMHELWDRVCDMAALGYNRRVA